MIKKGSWVTNCGLLLGKVREVYYDNGDPLSGELLLNIVLYDRKGNIIGRESPAEGGPTDFEPACPASDWLEIKKPVFPLKSMFGYIDDSLVEFIQIR